MPPAAVILSGAGVPQRGTSAKSKDPEYADTPMLIQGVLSMLSPSYGCCAHGVVKTPWYSMALRTPSGSFDYAPICFMMKALCGASLRMTGIKGIAHRQSPQAFKRA